MSNKTFILGLTGLTGSGKSTFCNTLKDIFNTKVINADKISREIIETKECKNDLVKAFSNKILTKENKINRSMLAKVAFSTKENTLILNNITHPIIKSKIETLLKAYKEKNLDSIVLDIPLLFESNIYKLCNSLLTVLSKEENRIERILKRDNILKEEALLRIHAQNNNHLYKTPYAIYNNSSLHDFLLKTVASYIYIKEQFYESQN